MSEVIPKPKKPKHAGGRPSEYTPKYIAQVKEYLDERQDEDLGFDMEAQGHGGALMRKARLRVKLPTIEGFAVFIGVNKTSLYEWEKQHPEFSNALDRIRQEQHQRLLDNGLSGDYNPTIAKLVLSANHGMREKTETDIKSDGKELKPGTIVINNPGPPREEA